MILKIKDKKFICRNYVFDIIYNENNRIKGVSLWTKDPNDPKRPDPQHCNGQIGCKL